MRPKAEATMTITDEQDAQRIIGTVPITHYADDPATEGWVSMDELAEVEDDQINGRGCRYYIGDVRVAIGEDGNIEPLA